MFKSKLLKILMTFDETEWKDFRRYLIYKNPRNPKIIDLFDYVKKCKGNFTSKKLEIDEARTSIKLGFMPRKNFQNAMSRLTIIIQEYLIVQSVLKDEVEVDYRIFLIYNDRNLYNLANKKVNVLKKRWNNSKDLDLKKVEYLVRLQHTQYFSENPIKYEKGNLVLEDLFRSFKDFNFIYNEFYSYAIEKVNSINRSDPIKFEVIGQSKAFLISEISKIVVNINQLYRTSDKQAFEYLYQTLKLNDQLSPEIKILIFSVCETYLQTLSEKGQSGHNSKTILYLYQFGISSGILLYNNTLSTVKFSNILTYACGLEEFEWAEEYVKKYIDLVPSDDREESFVISKIKIHFGKWEYEEALNLLNTSILNNFSLKMQGRWYSLVIYFITFDNFDFLESQMSSFVQFFYYNKKRVSFRIFDGSLNLAKIFRSAVSFSKDFNLETEIAKYENIIFKNRLASIFEQRRIYKKAINIDL